MNKILMIFGGNSYEHEVSIKSAENLYKYIDKSLFDITTTYITKENDWYIFNNEFKNINISNLKKVDNIIEYLKTFDCVINIIHGNNGEDGKIQSLLELFNISYIGCESISSVITMNKDLTKIILNSYNIPQVKSITLNINDDININLDYPLIIKPNNGGSSIGIFVVYNETELKEKINESFKYSDTVVIEEFIENIKELECSVIEDEYIYVSTIGEILPSNTFYDYEDKYIKNESKTLIPADIDELLIKEIKTIAKKAFKALNCKDFSRIDFIYDKTNKKLYLNEINTLPGFTEISMFSKLLEYDGYNLTNLITKLLNKAIN